MILPNTTNNQSAEASDVSDEILIKTADGRFKVVSAPTKKSFTAEIPAAAIQSALSDGKAEIAVDEAVMASSPPAPAIESAGNIDTIFTAVAAAINFIGDEVSAARLRKIIIAYLKDVRDYLETKEVLTRSPKVGGLSLSEELAVKAIQAVDQYKEKSRDRADRHSPIINKSTPPAINSTSVAPSAIRPAASTPIKLKNLAVKKFEFKPDEEKLLPPPPPMIIPRETVKAPEVINKLSLKDDYSPRNISNSSATTKDNQPRKIISGLSSVAVNKETKKAAPSPVKSEPPKIKAAESAASLLTKSNETGRRPLSANYSKIKTSGKTPIADIKRMSPLVGPLEEIGRLSLEDFRRLHQDPALATAKVRDKILLLGEESFTGKVAAIRAWQGCEVYRLYLNIGEKSIKGNKSIQEVIKEQEKNGEKTLREAEFKAIMKLNRQLKF